MEGEYPIVYNGKTIGKSTITEEGLYCRISCKCTFPDRRPWRIRMGNQDLGLCFQIGKERGLQKRVQKKHMPKIINFEAFLPENRNFYPLGSDMPFPKLDQLLSMAFAVENGIPGLVLKSKE